MTLDEFTGKWKAFVEDWQNESYLWDIAISIEQDGTCAIILNGEVLQRFDSLVELAKYLEAK